MSTNNSTSSHALSRRSFIAGAGLAASGIAAAANGGIALADEESDQPETEAEAAYPAWLGEPPVIADADIKQVVEADVVVVGGGNSGCLCATAAAEAGATVAVVESQSQDIMSYYGLCDVATVNSEFTTNAGVPEKKKSEFIAEFQRRNRNRTNPALVRQFVNESGEMLDWLVAHSPQDVVDRILVENLDTNDAYFEQGQEINRFTCWNGTVQIDFNSAAPKLIEDAQAQGATWYWGNKAVVLCTEQYEEDATETQTAEDGTATEVPTTVTRTRVTGVIAKNEDGDYVKFVGTKGLVLACGDYGGNAEMFCALQDDQRELFESHGLDTSDIHCNFGRDGSGIKMGLWAGGSMDPGARCIISPQVLFESDHYAQNVLRWASGYSISAGSTANASGSGTSQNPWGAPFVCLDESGRRFMDETFLGVFGQMARIERRKPQKYFFLFDNKYKELISRMAPEHMSEPTGVPGSLDYEALFDSWVERGAEGAPTEDGGTVCAWAANTLDELYDYMGLTDEQKANVQDEIDRYNGFCVQGEDEDFGRDPKMLMDISEPPFFGMYSVEEKPMVGIVTLNGLVIGDHQEVLDKNYNPIEGLYATGNNSGGRFAVEYTTQMAGLTIGMAMTLGRVLGKQLAAL